MKAIHEQLAEAIALSATEAQERVKERHGEVWTVLDALDRLGLDDVREQTVDALGTCKCCTVALPEHDLIEDFCIGCIALEGACSCSWCRQVMLTNSIADHTADCVRACVNCNARTAPGNVFMCRDCLSGERQVA